MRFVIILLCGLFLGFIFGNLFGQQTVCTDLDGNYVLIGNYYVCYIPE